MQPKPLDPHLPAALQDFESELNAIQANSAGLKAGRPCPACGKAVLDYDGLLNLSCPRCGFASGGGGGCT